MKFPGPRLGLRERPEGRTRMSEAAGRVCAGERTWTKTGGNFIQDTKGMCKKTFPTRKKISGVYATTKRIGAL